MKISSKLKSKSTAEKQKQFSKLDSTLLQNAFLMVVIHQSLISFNFCHVLSKKLLKKENSYKKYDNYDAIEVPYTDAIPKDYDGVMGVPITFLDKYNPNQFEIIGQMVTTKIDEFNHGYPYVNGKKIYARILIKHKKGTK